MINLKKESTDDLADLYDLMRYFTHAYCIRTYGFSVETVITELNRREYSLLNQ